MIAFLREKKGKYEDRDKVVWGICLEARKEALEERGSKAKRRQIASNLLVGLFIPGLWRVFDEANRPGILGSP